MGVVPGGREGRLDWVEEEEVPRLCEEWVAVAGWGGVEGGEDGGAPPGAMGRRVICAMWCCSRQRRVGYAWLFIQMECDRTS